MFTSVHSYHLENCFTSYLFCKRDLACSKEAPRLHADLWVFHRPEAFAIPHTGQKTFEALDKAISEILDECYQDAKRIIGEKRDAVERVMQALVLATCFIRPELSGKRGLSWYFPS